MLPVAYHWLQSQILVFVISAQWKDCLKVDLAEAPPKVVKETGCFHITQDIPLIFFFLQGPVTLVHFSQEFFDKFITAHCFLSLSSTSTNS